MTHGERIISGQLRVGDGERSAFGVGDIIAKIDAARRLAGMNRLLYLPSRDDALNKAVIGHCRKSGIEIYLWFKTLADNDVMAEPGELAVNAFGGTAGESGVWRQIFHAEESFVFGCPQNEKYNNLLLSRCEQALEPFDGLFADSLGYPLPSLGLESVFTCFCPVCMEREPRLKEWRRNVLNLRESMECCSDDDIERWGTFRGHAEAFGLGEFYGSYRTGLLTALAGRYREVADRAGKGFGLDVLSPALAFLAGHDYAELGKLADWLKPRIYCHTYGPSSIPLEYYCMAIGAQRWIKRASIAAIMDFISRSIGIELPKNLHRLTNTYLSRDDARRQIEEALDSTTGPAHPGIECSIHPDYETELDGAAVRGYLEAAAAAPGIVLCWNLLFIPDAFLRIVGETTA